MNENVVSIMGALYHKRDVIKALEDSECKVILTEFCTRDDIQTAMESLNFTQANKFWELLIPQSIGKDKPLMTIKL